MALSMFWWFFCHGFIFLSPAAAGTGPQLFEPNSVLIYSYQSTLLLNEATPDLGKDVGFRITAQLSVETVWQSASLPDSKLLLLKLVNPKLSIKSRKAPAPEGFVLHSSKLEELKNGPFLIHWKNGLVKSVYINQNEVVSLVNLKKGVASLFQFQTINYKEIKETDASGLCSVEYTNVDKNMIEKLKTNCSTDSDLSFIKQPNEIWGATILSNRRSVILLTSDLKAVDSIDSEEKHSLSISLRQEANAVVKSQQQIKLKDRSSGSIFVKENNLDDAVSYIEKAYGLSLAKHSLTLTKENSICSDGSCPLFYTVVKDNRDALKANSLGTARSASAFIKLLNVAREAKKEDLLKALKHNKNKDILMQLMDLMGAVQTKDSHEAALKVLNFKSEEVLDLNERYLWSLSLSSHPSRHIIKDLIKIMDSGPYNQKLDETIVMTIAAITKKWKHIDEKENNEEAAEVFQMFTSKLKKCPSSDISCYLKYIRALKNLGTSESIPILLSHATTGPKRVSVAAISAVHSLPESEWSQEVINVAKRLFFQLDKRYDSSARTLALDILLRKNPSKKLLSELLLSLQRKEQDYEVKQYLWQRMKQIGESDKNFLTSIQELINTLKLANYDVLSQKGLSTAFTRSFMKHSNANGSLSTIQEMSGGIVKRGLVDVVIEQNGTSQSIFTLGLFAGGLSSFLSSEESTVTDAEEEMEIAEAGMELNVMGVQVRPFVFFNGQGELMGHVWSGTASEKTTAFQAISLLQDHLQCITLQAGYIAELNLQGGISFDLSGQISLSIWNRNAESLVEKSAGLSVTGMIRVNTFFVQSQVQFNIGNEVKLLLLSNIDFYSNIALCLQLQQPDSVIRHNVHKTERIPGSKHKLRKSKYKVLPVPGRTYALNQKNNELCNIIFAE